MKISARLSLTANPLFITSLLIVGLCASPQAQTAHFSGAQTAIYNTSSVTFRGVAIDAGGALYIGDMTNQRILKESPSAAGYVETVYAVSNGGGNPAFTPYGLCFGPDGSLYVVDGSANQLLKETAPLSGVLQAVTTISALNAPYGVAVDSAGAVYIANYNAGVLKETIVGFAGTAEAEVETITLNHPSGVAVDAAFNVYIADTGDSVVLVEAAVGGGTSYTESSLTTTAVLGMVTSIASDAAGNLYLGNDSGQVLKEACSAPGVCVESKVLTSGVGAVTGAAFDAGGNVYLADSDHGRVVKSSSSAANLGGTAVGATSSAATVFFTMDSAGGSISSAVLTQGTPSLDFIDAGTGSCAASGYNPGDLCTVNVAITPRTPGSRKGAVVLLDGSSNAIAKEFVYATGTGPQVLLLQAAESQVDPAVTGAYGIATDGAGNVYVADADGGNILLEPAGTTLVSGLTTPHGIAVDGQGDLYFTSGAVIHRYSRLFGTDSTVTSAATSPVALAVDGAGNLYVADADSTTGVFKETLRLDGGYDESAVAIGGGLQNAHGVAVDGAGSIYVADTNNNRVTVETLTGGTYVQSQVFASLAAPASVAVDKTGNVVIADAGHNHVLLESLAAGTYTETVLKSGVSSTGVAVADNGDVYYAGGAIHHLDYSGSPALGFLNTATGASSAANSLKLVNIGNSALTFPAPLAGNNPSASTHFALDNGGAPECPVAASGGPDVTVAAGTVCTLSVTFSPDSVTSFNGTLSITDDSLNAAGPVFTGQTVSLNGDGIAPPDATTTALTITPNSVVSGTSATFSAVIADTTSGAVTPTGTLSFSDTINGNTTSLTTGYAFSNGTASASFAFPTIGTHTFTVTFVPFDSTAFAGSSDSQVLTVTAPAPTITFTGGGNATFGDADVALGAATSNSSGAITYSIAGPGSLSGTTVHFTGAGTVTVTASVAADSSYTAGTLDVVFTVAKASPTITFTGSANATFGDADVVLGAATANSSGAITYSIAGPGSLSGTTVHITGAGTVTVTAHLAADSDYAADTKDVVLTVAKASPTITFTGSASATFGDADVVLGSASSNSSGAVTYSIAGPGSLSGTTVHFTGAGTVTVTAHVAADSDYTGDTKDVVFTVAKASPTVTFTGSANATFGDADVVLGAATANSSGAVTYSIAGPGSLSGTTVHFTGAGTVTVTAHVATDSDYAADTKDVVLTVAKASPTITFTGSANATFGDVDVVLGAASSNSSGAVTYSIAGPGSLSGTTVHFTGAGTVTVTAHVAADSDYTADTKDVVLTVAKASPTVTFTGSANATFGDADVVLGAATANSSGAVTYSIAGPGSLSGTTVHFTGAGTVTVTAHVAGDSDYSADTKDVVFTVAKASPTVTFTGSANATFGDADVVLGAASSNSSGAVTYSIAGPGSITGTTVHFTGAGTVTVTAHLAADSDYSAATKDVVFTVAKGTPTISFVVADEIYGDPAVVANTATSPESTGAFTYALVSGPATVDSDGTVHLTGSGTVVIRATLAADANYVGATQDASFTVRARTVWIGNDNANLSAFDVSGIAESGTGFGGGSLGVATTPLGLAFDHSGTVWVAHSTGLSQVAYDGSVMAVTAVGGINDPRSVAIDGDGQVWVANANGTLSALKNDGTAMSPGSGYTGTGVGTPGAIAVDLSGNVWLTNTTDNSVTEVIGAAAPVAPIATAVASATVGARP